MRAIRTANEMTKPNSTASKTMKMLKPTKNPVLAPST